MNFLCTLFRLIFIDLQNVGVISAAPCISGGIPRVLLYQNSKFSGYPLETVGLIYQGCVVMIAYTNTALCQ